MIAKLLCGLLGGIDATTSDYVLGWKLTMSTALIFAVKTLRLVWCGIGEPGFGCHVQSL
jgi:hypothetical protein